MAETNERSTTEESAENFARLSVKAKVGNGPDERVTVKGTEQQDSLEEIDRDTLERVVEETALAALLGAKNAKEQANGQDDDE